MLARRTVQKALNQFLKNPLNYQFCSYKNNYNLLLIGGNSNPMPEIFEQNFYKKFKAEKDQFDIHPQYKFINSEAELESVLANEFNNKIDMISLTEFGPKQVDLLLKAYEKQKANVKIIHGFLVGVDKFLPQINDKVAKDVIIANAKGSFSDSLGEYVVFSCLYHAKRAKFFLEMQEKKKWIREPINMLKNKNVAIFGFGNIGMTIGKYLKKMDMNVLAVTNPADKITEEQRGIASEIYRSPEYPDVLAQADYVVSIMPLTKETNQFWNKEKFSMMNKDTVFINIGRGQSVVESELAEALRSKHLSGASLDVFDVEPLNVKSELWDIDNLFISQHCADVTHDYWELTYGTFIDNLVLNFEGKKMKNIVDRVIGY